MCESEKERGVSVCIALHSESISMRGLTFLVGMATAVQQVLPCVVVRAIVTDHSHKMVQISCLLLAS